MAHYGSYMMLVAAVLLGLAKAALIDPSLFADANHTFSGGVYQSYGNTTRDACYIRDVAMGAKRPKYSEAADVYAKGKFAFRFSSTTGIVSNVTRTIYSVASRSYAPEAWFNQYASYYKKNASAPFYVDWMNATLTGAKPFSISSKVRVASTKSLVMLLPVYYMYHEVHAGLNGLTEENDIEGAAEEVVHGFFAFYGPEGNACSVPVLFQAASKSLCTLDKAGVSTHLKSLEAAFIQLVKGAKQGNTTAGLAAFELGRQQMFQSVSYSAFQLMLLSAQKAAKFAKMHKLDNYRAAVAEGRAYFRMVEPYVYSKSKGAARRLITLFNFTTSKPKTNLLAQVKVAMTMYLKTVGASWKTVWGC